MASVSKRSCERDHRVEVTEQRRCCDQYPHSHGASVSEPISYGHWLGDVSALCCSSGGDRLTQDRSELGWFDLARVAQVDLVVLSDQREASAGDELCSTEPVNRSSVISPEPWS